MPLGGRAPGWSLGTAPSARAGGRPGPPEASLPHPGAAGALRGLLLLLSRFRQVLSWHHHSSPATGPWGCSFWPSVTTFAIPELCQPSPPGSETWKSRENHVGEIGGAATPTAPGREPLAAGSVYQTGWLCCRHWTESGVQVSALPLAGWVPSGELLHLPGLSFLTFKMGQHCPLSGSEDPVTTVTGKRESSSSALSPTERQALGSTPYVFSHFISPPIQ